MALSRARAKVAVTAERWRRIKAVLAIALDHEGGDARAAAVDAACAGDASLRREIAELLQCRDAMGSFLDVPNTDPGAARAEPAVPIALHEWSRFEVLDRVGAGGMATVYKAWDPRLQRPIAIKVISERDAPTVARFMREAEAQARVDHDNVLKIYETGVVGPHHYIAMQFVDGPTLLGVRVETTIDQKVELIRQIAEGLHAAHRLGLVHRDIKPSNILVERRGDGLRPYLLDFGLVAVAGAPGMTETGVIVGTPRYMAPERIRNGEAALDRRSDIYSLGATCYEFICGTAPFDDSSGLQLLIDVVERDFAPPRAVLPTLSPDLDAIVTKCIEKDPNERYPSARALADDLRRYLDGDAVLARPAGRVRRWMKKARKHRRLTLAFAALAIAIVATAGWGGYQYWRSTRQADIAQQLGEEIQNVDWMFRAAQMSPLHAIAPQKREVRERMDRIDVMMRTVGSIAYGPGHYALGRGFLTLGDDARAIEQLESAWNAGYRTADVATSLGLAYENRFQDELTKAQRIETDAARETRIQELETTLRDRALRFLRDGRASLMVPASYVDALVAWLSGDSAGANRSADETARLTPWLFEARLLPARIAFKEAVRVYFRKDFDATLALANEARRHYAGAARIAASAVDAAIGECAVDGLVLRVLLESHPEADLVEPSRNADGSCGRALTIEPDRAEASRLYAEALATAAAVTVQRRQDPGDAFDRAAVLADRAIALARGEIDARLTLADIDLNRGWWQSRAGNDPRRSIDAAVALYDGVLRTDPRNVTAADNLGQALVLRSRFEATQGLDPTETQSRAIEAFERSIRLDPALAFGFTNLERVTIARADDQARRGVDPTAPLRAVIAFVEALPTGDAPGARAKAIARLRTRLGARLAANPASSAAALPDGR